jgi:hypothetical protein
MASGGLCDFTREAGAIARQSVKPDRSVFSREIHQTLTKQICRALITFL